jgi:hypothetical protein
MIQTTPGYDSPPLRTRASTSSIHLWNTRATIIGTLTLLVATFVLGGCTNHPRKASGSWGSAKNTAPVDQLTLLHEAADYEGLYTLAGGLKPMSSGFWQCSFEADEPDLRELHRVQELLKVLQNDVWYADVQIFDKIHDGERNAHAFVVHRKSLASMIERHESFWTPRGITPDTHPTEIVEIVDRMPRDDRWRGYGYLYGYPDEAVDFFVEAGIAADDGGEMGPGKDRQFTQIPTYAADSGRFTYAVPLEHVSTVADQALADRAAIILAAYVESRPRMKDTQSTTEELLRLNTRFGHLQMNDILLEN